MAACRTRPTACDTHFPALCPARALLARVPLGPRPSLHRLRRRSPGLVRWLPRYYGGVRPLGFVHHRLRLLVFPIRTRGIPPLANPEISRFPCKELPHMPGSRTTPGRAAARAIASVRVAFRAFEHVGTQVAQVFAAQWLAYVLPYRRFADTLASANARLRAGADRYSFTVVDFHLLLFAGLPGAPEVLISGYDSFQVDCDPSSMPAPMARLRRNGQCSDSRGAIGRGRNPARIMDGTEPVVMRVGSSRLRCTWRG